MRKVMACKAAPEIEISIDGGASVLLRFDISAISVLQEMEGGIAGIFSKSFPEMAACLVYAGGANNNSNFTLEDARRLVSCMSVANINDIVLEFSESLGIEQNEAQKEISKNLMAQFLRTL